MLSKEEVEAYCQEYYAPIYRFCMYSLSKKEDAEDATQETFIVFSRKGHLLEPEHIKDWLFATAYHMIQKEWTKRTLARNKEVVLDEEMLMLSRKVRTFEEDIIDYYSVKYIEDIYARLSDKEKMLFDLYSDGNIKTAKISQIMGIEPHACSMRKKRLKEKCREIITDFIFY